MKCCMLLGELISSACVRTPFWMRVFPPRFSISSLLAIWAPIAESQTAIEFCQQLIDLLKCCFVSLQSSHHPLSESRSSSEQKSIDG